jgi:hypothetical protein
VRFGSFAIDMDINELETQFTASRATTANLLSALVAELTTA